MKGRVGKNEDVEIHKRRSLTANDKLDILNAHPHCPECHTEVRSIAEAEFDHSIPLALGGTNEKDNFRALHKPCHKLKTKRDVAAIAKANRLRKRQAGLTRPKKAIPSRPFPKRTRQFERRYSESPDRSREGDAEPEEG